MSDDSPLPQNALNPSDEWADVEGVSAPVFRRSFAEESRVPIQPRVVISPRRREAERAAAENQGLRISPRVLTVPAERPEDAGSKPMLKLQEHGKEVVRLETEAAAPYAERPSQLPTMQPRGAKSANREARLAAEWGKSVRHSYKWLGWVAGAVALLVLVGLVVQPLLEQKHGNKETEGLSTLRVVEDVVKTDNPTVFFEDNPVQVVEEIHQTMSVYARAQSLEEALPVMRHGEMLKSQLSKVWKPWGFPSDWTLSDSDLIGYDSVARTPYVVISGTRPDFSQYIVYLVREGGKMLVDWEASEGLCTHNLQELNDPGLEAAEVRVEAAPVAYYTMGFPEDHYRAFRLVLGGSENFIWGYVVRGSPADQAMEDIFMEKQQFSDKPASGKVRLRLKRGKDGAMANQWLILDVLHKGWVTP